MITLDRLREIERVANEMVEIGGDDLRRSWSFVAAIADLARRAVDEPASQDQMVEAMKFNVKNNYGGNGSFSDWDPHGPGYARFQKLRDELARLVLTL
jgi:hypothetical protein